MAKRALITGITGQDGSYLGYEVHGLVRRVALEDPQRRFTRISNLLDKIVLHPASLESYPSIFSITPFHSWSVKRFKRI
jgi:GDPmannose 4,6-dehydratase